MSKPKLTPWPMLYVEDATHKYTKEFVEKCGGQIIDVWLFDLHMTVNCCEITPSHEMHYYKSILGRYPEDDDLREKLDEQLDVVNANGQELIQYFQWRGALRGLTTDIGEMPKEDVPKSWDEKTLPFVMEAEPPDEEMWQEYLDENDGDFRRAHNRLMEGVMEEINANHPI